MVRIKWNDNIFILIWTSFCIGLLLLIFSFKNHQNYYDIKELSNTIWETDNLNSFNHDNNEFTSINAYYRNRDNHEQWDLASGLKKTSNTLPLFFNKTEELINYYNISLEKVAYLLKNHNYYMYASKYPEYIIYGDASETGKIYSKRPLNIENFKIEHNIYNMEQSKNDPHVYYWNGYKNHNPDYKIKLNEEDLFLDTEFTN